jgi:phosphate transport system substrate-binding protein
VRLGGAGATLLALLGPARADVKLSQSRHVEVRGAGAMFKFAALAAEGFMAEHPDTTVTASGEGTYGGIKSVVIGTADIALVTGDIPDELQKAARDRKVEFVRREVFRDAVAILVHPSNPINDLGFQRARDVFRGAITNWKEIGGKDLPIVVVTHASNTGIYDALKHRVLGDGAVMTPRAVTVTWDDFAKHMTEGAISFASIHSVGRYEAGQHKVIKIDGVAPTTETLASGQYPVQRQLAIVHAANIRPPARAVVDYFLAQDKGQAIVRALGDVPVTMGETPKPPAQPVK